MVCKHGTLILAKILDLRTFSSDVLFPINLAFAAEFMNTMLADSLL
jgi:hypothetical protein